MHTQHLTRLTAIAVVAVVAGAIVAPAASARIPDEQHDMRASTTVTTAEAQKQDLRSPDARDAATPVEPKQDFRSPDTVDAAAGRGTFSAPEVVVVKVKEPQAIPSADGLDWTDAGIGAGVLVGLGLIALGGTLAVTHRRQGRAVLH